MTENAGRQNRNVHPAFGFGEFAGRKVKFYNDKYPKRVAPELPLRGSTGA
jgi:hypothetical protein